MGIQAMVKHTISNMRNNNESNPSTGKVWTRRVTDIAGDLERSGDPAKKEKFHKFVATVAAEFDSAGSGPGTSPQTFVKRQEILLQAEAKLDEFKAPPEDRDIVMKEAVQKDEKKLESYIKTLCESSLPMLKELHSVLPSLKTMRTEGVSDEILAEKGSFAELQIAMARVSDKLSNMQQMGFIDANVMVVIFQLEDPDVEPHHWTCGTDETFGELLTRAYLSNTEPLANEGEDDAEDDEDDIIPDVWIKKWDAGYNCVTKSRQSWECQPEHTKIRDAFACATTGSGEMTGQKKWSVDIVSKKGDYVVALVNDNGKERGKAVDLPKSIKKTKPANDHLKTVFANYKVAKVLDLKEGKDASMKMFNKIHFRPRTNPLYVELEAFTPENVASPIPGGRYGTV